MLLKQVFKIFLNFSSCQPLFVTDPFMIITIALEGSIKRAPARNVKRNVSAGVKEGRRSLARFRATLPGVSTP